MSSSRFSICGAVTIVAATWLSAVSGSQAASPNWVSLFSDYDAKYGSQYLTSTDGKILAWGESELLESYIWMYRATGNTAYMQEATNHINYLWSVAAQNTDGSGWAWETAGSSVDKILNGTFATPSSSDATLPASWTRGPHSNSTNAYYSSTNGLTLTAGNNKTASVSQMFNTYMIRPSLKTFYEVSFEAKGSGLVEVLVDGISVGSQSFSSTSSKWQTLTFAFLAPRTAGRRITVELSTATGAAAGTNAYFSSVSVSGRLPYVDHDGMILHAIAEYILVVNQNQSALSQFNSSAQTFLSDIETHDFATRWQKIAWVQSGSLGFYIFPSDWSEMRSGSQTPPGSSFPYNEDQEYGRFLMVMYQLTGKKAYLKEAVGLGNTLKAAMAPNGQGYIWHYMGKLVPADSVRKPLVEDAAHANFDISFIADLYQLGVSVGKSATVFTLADMQAFDYTFMNDTYNSSSAELYRFVNATGGLNVSPWNHSYANFTQLSSIDPNVLNAVTALFNNASVTTLGGDFYPLTVAKMAYYSTHPGAP